MNHPPKKRFCVNGHDTDIAGRYPGSACKVCSKARSYVHWTRSKIINLDGSAFTILDFERLFKEQEGRCHICQAHSTTLNQRLSVDHDHKTQIVRGLLCHYCNKGIGQFRENVQFIQNAVMYLKGCECT